MNLLKKIDQVSFLDSNDSMVFVGVDTSKKPGDIISNGNKVIALEKGEIVKELEMKFFYLMAYKQGIIFNIEEGDPLYFTDLSHTKEIYPKGGYFNSLQIRDSLDYFFLSEMDEEFNGTYFVFDDLRGKRLMPTFISFGNHNGFIKFKKKDNQVTCYEKENFEISWSVTYDIERYGMKRDGKIFGDKTSIFVPLTGGRLMSINAKNGDIHWVWPGHEGMEGSFDEVGDFLYQSFWKGLFEIEKSTGKTSKRLLFEDIDSLSEFHAIGPIWCFETCIVLVNFLGDKLIVVNRASFEIEGTYETDRNILANKRTMVKYIDGVFYVRCLDNSVRLLELDPEIDSKPVKSRFGARAFMKKLGL